MRIKHTKITGYSPSYQGEFERIHKCVGCGEEYAYDIKGSVGMNHYSPTKAEITHTLKQAKQDVVEPVPCPKCSLLQPEMVTMLRVRNAEGIFSPLLLSVVFLWAFFTPLLIKGTYHPRVATIIFVLLSINGVLVLYRAYLNPNSKIKTTKRNVPVPGGMLPVNGFRILMTLLLAVAVMLYWTGHPAFSFLTFIPALLLFFPACTCSGFKPTVKR